MSEQSVGFIGVGRMGDDLCINLLDQCLFIVTGSFPGLNHDAGRPSSARQDPLPDYFTILLG